jgi:hypothetical protein
MRGFDFLKLSPTFSTHTIEKFLPFLSFLHFIEVDQVTFEVLLNMLFDVSLFTAELWGIFTRLIMTLA